jgi:hypothetical protein
MKVIPETCHCIADGPLCELYIIMYFQSEIFDIAFSKTGAEGMQTNYKMLY